RTPTWSPGSAPAGTVTVKGTVDADFGGIVSWSTAALPHVDTSEFVLAMLGVPSAPKSRSAKKSLTVCGTSDGFAILASDCPACPGERFNTNHCPPFGPLGSAPTGETPTDGVPGGTWSADGAGGAAWA